MTALVRTWIVLLALTSATIWIGTSTGMASDRLRGGLMIAVSGLKAWAILRYFLDLRKASRSWQVLFVVYLAIVCGAIFTAYVVTGLVVRP
jgi:hypothetical protein